MWAVSRGVCLGILLLLSYMDIRIRKVPVKILMAAGMAAAGYHILCQEMNAWLLAGGMAVGLIFLFISRVTDESVGYGDSLAILILGVYLGFWELLEVLASAFCLLGVGVVILLGITRMSRKCLIPFFPFLTGGYILTMLFRGGVV